VTGRGTLGGLEQHTHVNIFIRLSPMREGVLLSFTSLIIRPNFRSSDTLFLLLSIIMGIAVGCVMGSKISMVMGLAFGVFSTVVFYYMWRTPA
jgi:hypothetical protein